MTHSNFIGLKGVLFIAGHEAVMIFFVLSGYVIAFVTDGKEKTLRDYSLSRIARIYSVALPAVILAVTLDYVGLEINAAGYPEGFNATDHTFIRIASSLLFTNELWFTSIQSFSNHPYWSLNYEVWYYLSFGSIVFFKGPRRWLLLGAIILIAGIKIALLAPIWWAGVWCYRSTIYQRISISGGWGLIAISAGGVFIYYFFHLEGIMLGVLRETLSTELYTGLAFSKRFLTDYFLTICVVTHFIGMRKVMPTLKGILRFERPIRWVANYTFALYLFHVPLLYFYRSVFDTSATDLEGYALVSFSTLGTIFILGTYTERQKRRVKNYASEVFDFVGKLFFKKEVK